MKVDVSSVNVKQIAEDRGLLTSREVADLAGISYRRLDHYVRAGYLSPAVAAQGSGSARLWEPAVVAQLVDLQNRVAQCPFCSTDANRSHNKP